MAQAMLKELGLEEETEPGYCTISELATLWGVALTTAKGRVRALRKRGKILDGKRKGRDAMGRVCWIGTVKFKDEE